MRKASFRKSNVLLAAVLQAALLMLLPCCASMQQDVSISADSAEDGGLASSAALELARADLAAVSGGKADSSRLTSLINSLENRLSSPERLDKSLEARLTALQGRAWLLKGNMGNAEKCYAKAAAKDADDVQVIILGHRLGKIAELGPYVSGRDDNAPLMLEQALDSYKGQDYSDAAGQFDTAFLYLDEDYKKLFGGLRDNSWQLKGTGKTDAGIAGLLSKKEITVQEMMLIAQGTSDVLNVYTASQKQDGARLFQTLIKEGLMNSVSNEQSPTAASMVNRSDSGVTAGTKATRLLAARFLWNLYWRGGAAPQKYSARYRARASAKSPVKDVPISSEDFDAVLGCVEKEWLSLEDGTSFNGSTGISGAAFSEGVKKLD